MHFIANNKKVLLFTWATTAVPCTAMIFCAIPYLQGPPPDTGAKVIIYLIFACGMPLFIWIVMFIVWLIDLYTFKKNLVYEPFKIFFERNGFEERWVDSEYLRVVSKGMFGTFCNKRMVCRINVQSKDVLDFVIYDLDADKLKKQRQSSYRANGFDLEEPKFYDGLACKSFYRTKKLTAEKISSELEALIRKYE